MKKLVVLMLVVGMASLASATFSISTSATSMNTTGSITVTIENDDSLALVDTAWFVGTSIGGNSFAVWDQTNMSVGSMPSVPAPGNAASVVYFGDALGSGVYYVALQTGATTNTIPVGIMATFELDAVAVGTLNLQLYDSSGTGTIGGTTAITVVPEPMTMALLGLGGLFLRRKK